MPDQPMTYMEHLEELRWRIIISLGALVVPFIVIYSFFGYDLLDLLRRPLLARSSEEIVLRTLAPFEIFLTVMKLSFAGALVVASPVVIYEVWAFVAPGLTRKERACIGPILGGGAVLFLSGVLVCYYLVLPFLYDFFLSMNEQAGTAIAWSTASVISSAMTMLLAFGVCFELPLVIVFLVHFGIITPQVLTNRRPHAIFAMAVLCAAITPPDPFSMLVLLGPLVGLYEFSVVLARITYRRRTANVER